MKEVYRSFEGKLDLDQSEGIVVCELDDWYEIQWLNVDKSITDTYFRIPKTASEPDWSEYDFSDALLAVEQGSIDGQMFAKGKWYSPKQIINARKDPMWRKYI